MHTPKGVSPSGGLANTNELKFWLSLLLYFSEWGLPGLNLADTGWISELISTTWDVQKNAERAERGQGGAVMPNCRGAKADATAAPCFPDGR